MDYFISKKKKRIIIRIPSHDDLEEIMAFYNKLINEDTFILRYGKPVTLEEEKKWLQDVMEKINKKQAVFLQAYFENHLIGQIEVTRGIYRKRFTGLVHIAIDIDFRREGIAEELLKRAGNEARKLGIKILNLTLFENNQPALNLYKKMGFQIFGTLPKSIELRGQMLDEIYMYKKLSGF